MRKQISEESRKRMSEAAKKRYAEMTPEQRAHRIAALKRTFYYGTKYLKEQKAAEEEAKQIADVAKKYEEYKAEGKIK